MSQVTHPSISVATRIRSHRVVALAWLLALLAAASIVLALALDGDSPVTERVGAGQSVAAPRTDGISSASAVGTRATPVPDESRIAASVGGAYAQPATGRDESRVAEAVGGGSSPSAGAPDESRTAVSVSGR